MSAAYRQKLTLHDVWQAAQNDRHFDYIFWIHVILDILVETALRHFGYCLVLLACILIFCLISAGFLVVLPAITMKGSPWYYLHFLLGSCISFFVIFNYYKAVTTKPGTPSDYITEDFLGEHFCKKCNFPKPERSHHCSICNQCVMKMDHHCPWLSNCVGLRNYRFFICFLFWVTIGTFYLSLLCSPKVFVEDSILSPTVLAHKVRGYFFSSPAPSPIIPPHDEELLPLQDKTRYHHKEEKQYLRNRENVYSVIYDQYKQHKYLRNHPQENDEQSLQTDEGRRKLSHNHTTSYDEYFNTSNFNFFLPFMNNQKSQLKEVHQTDNTITYDMKHTLAGSINKEMKDQSKLVKRRLENDEISFTNNLSESSPTWNKFFMDEYVVFLAIFMIAIGISLATACLLCMHLYLVCTNQTTIELFQARLDMSRGRGYGSYENPYDKGLSRNFEEVMGTRWWHLAFLPTFRQVDPLIEEFKDRPDHPCYCLSCV